MKLLACVIAVIAVAGLLAYTNPTIEDYNQFVHNGILKEVQKQDPAVQLFGSAMSALASGLVASQTVREDFIFFSTYELRVGKEEFKAVGILKNFYVTKKPDFKSRKPN